MATIQVELHHFYRASAKQISEAPETSKTFQAMLDVAVAHALDLVTQLAGNSLSLSSVNSSTQDDDDACTTPNVPPSPYIAKTLEWTPTANVSVSEGATNTL